MCFQSDDSLHVQPFDCEHCDRTFSDPTTLQHHIRTYHNGARAHACPECGKTFATSSGLKQHQHIHSTVKPFQCEVCLKAYTQFSNLCRHKRMHADCRQQIKCKDCGQAFSTMTSLGKHKRFCQGAMAALQNGVSHSPGVAGSGLSPGYPHKPLTVSTSGSDAMIPGFPAAFPNMYMSVYGPRAGFPFFPPLASSFPMFPGHGASVPLSPPHVTTRDRSPHRDLELRHLPGPGKRKHSAERAHTSDSEDSDRDDVTHRGRRVNNLPHSPARPFPYQERVDSLSRSQRSPPGFRVYERSRDDPRAHKDKLYCHDTGLAPRYKESHRLPMHRSPSHRSPVRPEPQGKAEQPLDLSSKSDRSPSVETPRKTHIFGKDSPSDVEDEEEGPKVRMRSVEPRYRDSNRSRVEPTERGNRSRLESMVCDNRSRPEPLDRDNRCRLESMDRDKSVAKPQPIPASLSTQSKLLEHAEHPVKVHDAYPVLPNPALVSRMYSLERSKMEAFHEAARMMSLGPAVAPRFPFHTPNSQAFSPMGLVPQFMPHSPINQTSRVPPFLKGPSSFPYPHNGMPKSKYACKFCGKIFPRSANLTRHLRTHTGEQPYKCKYCERSFSISSNLQRHIRNIHNKEKPFKCPICDRCFGQQTNLDRHIKKHEVEGPTVCDSPSPQPLGCDWDLGSRDAASESGSSGISPGNNLSHGTASPGASMGTYPKDPEYNRLPAEDLPMERKSPGLDQETSDLDRSSVKSPSDIEEDDIDLDDGVPEASASEEEEECQVSSSQAKVVAVFNNNLPGATYHGCAVDLTASRLM